MTKRTKKIAQIAVGLLCGVCLFGGVAACAKEKSQNPIEFVYTVENVEALSLTTTPEYFDTYGVGETIAINNYQTETLYAVLQKDYKVYALLTPETEQVTYTFEEKGTYNLIYYTKGADNQKTVMKNIRFTVGDQPYIDIVFKSQYMINDTFSVKADCVYGTSKAEPTVRVTSPLGDDVPLTDLSAKLTQCGKYTISYTAQIEGLNVARTYYVNVVGSSNSHADYFLNVAGVTNVEAEIESPDYAVDGTGVRITGASSAIFRFANIIDLNSVEQTDNMVNILPLGTDGYSTLSKMVVRFIDVYDETNKVSYELTWQVQKDPHTYAKILYKTLAKAKKPVGQTGFYENTIYGLGAGGVHFNVEKFCMVEPYFGNVKWLRTQLDYEQRKFFLTGGQVAKPDEQREILDLDDPSHVGYGNEWNGFTTGEVYLQVEMTGRGSQTGCIVQEIAGEKMYGETTSEKAPGTLFEVEENGKLPTGELDRYYPFPKVDYSVDTMEGKLASPAYEVLTLEYEVLPKLKYTTVALAGKDGFTPEKAGTYRIMYKIADSQGNEAEYYRFFDVIETLGEKGVVYDVSVPKNFKVGTYFTVPKLIKSGLSYLTKCEESISYNGKEYLDKAGEKVFLDVAGTIRVKGSYVDYFGESYEYEETYEVTASDETITEVKGIVPKYVVKGRTIVLPDMRAINYSKLPTASDYQTPWQLLVNGNAIDTNLREYKVEQNHGESVAVEYKVGSQTIHTATMTVVEANYLSDRFYVSTGTVEKEDTLNGVVLNVSGDATVDYINPLLINTTTKLPITFDFEENKANFEYVDVYYEDYLYSEIKVFVRITKKEDGYVGLVNAEGQSIPLNLSNTYKGYEILYNVKTNAFDFEMSKIIKTDVNGNPFNGFPSKRVNVSFKIHGATGETQMRISEMGAFGMLSSFDGETLLKFEDKSIPSIVSEKTYRDNTWLYGDVVKMYAVEARTALSGLTTAKLTVTAPSGKKILNNVNAYNDYEFTIDEYGTYQIQYSVPFRSTTYKFNYSARVFKEELPEINIEGEFAQTYKKGDSLTVPKFTVTGVEETHTLTIYLIYPDLTMKTLSAGESVVLEKCGSYRLSITVADEYNTTFKSWNIKVEG